MQSLSQCCAAFLKVKVDKIEQETVNAEVPSFHKLTSL